jgi:cellobiose dehydrogenase (acceptor)
MSQYLGRGAVSRGRMTITSSLNTAVSTVPYLRDQNDIEAVIKGIENLQNALKNVPGLKFVQPPPGTTARDFVNNVSPSLLRTDVALTTPDGRIAVQPPRKSLDR